MGSTIALAEAIAAEASFLPEGWEIKVVGSAEDPDAPAPSGPLLESNELTGEVVAIVGVTGIVDHVGDLIEPGAYADTLAKRRPKICWAHSWEMPVGKVLQAEEWMPGDRRFAEVKATLDGKPWPADAGALVVRGQFNMKSDRGREAFAAVDFYSESGECEWSIGWQPIAKHTVKRKDGVRVCRKVELFEVSPVLFGAAPLTRTLQVKSIRLADAQLPALERKAGVAAGTQPGAGPDENLLHSRAMGEIDWAEVDAAAQDDPDPDGEPDGDGDEQPPAGPPAGAPAAGGAVAVDAKSLFAFADALLDTPVDLAHLGEVTAEVKAEGGADQNRGNAEELRRWYVSGEGAAKIRWPEEGAFGRCVEIASAHMDPERAKGYCNLRHKDATGHYAGEKKSAAVAAAELLAKSWSPLLEVGADAAHTDRKYLGEGRLRGTFEQRQQALDRALTRLLRNLDAGEDATEPDEDDDGRGPVSPESGWVSVEGTWEDRVVATWVEFENGSCERETYEVPYTWDGEDVVLGTPRRVELQVTVVPADGDGDGDGDEDGAEDALIAPVLLSLTSGVDLMKSALGRTEVKAGRVLSEANASRLRGALEHLLEVARSAGIDLPGWTGPEGTAVDDGQTPDTTAPATPGTGAARAAGAPAPTPAAGPPAVKVLSQFDLAAQLAELDL